MPLNICTTLYNLQSTHMFFPLVTHLKTLKSTKGQGSNLLEVTQPVSGSGGTETQVF